MDGGKKSEDGWKVTGSQSRICAGEDADTHLLTRDNDSTTLTFTPVSTNGERAAVQKKGHPPFEIIDPDSK